MNSLIFEWPSSAVEAEERVPVFATLAAPFETLEGRLLALPALGERRGRLADAGLERGGRPER